MTQSSSQSPKPVVNKAPQKVTLDFTDTIEIFYLKWCFAFFQ